MNIKIDDLISKQLAEIYVVSNTPHYLFKNLRRHFFVESIARDNSVAVFQETSEEIQSRGEFTDADQLLSYVLICGLSLKSGRDVATVLKSLGAFPFRWASILAEIAIASLKQDTVQTINFNPSILVH